MAASDQLSAGRPNFKLILLLAVFALLVILAIALVFLRSDKHIEPAPTDLHRNSESIRPLFRSGEAHSLRA